MMQSADTLTPHLATPSDPVPNWGREVRTDYGTASHMYRSADEITMTIPQHLVLFNYKPISRREVRRGGTHVKKIAAASGASEIVPAGADFWARWEDDKEVAAFYLSDSWLDHIAQSDLDLPSAQMFVDAGPIFDRRIAMIGHMFRAEMAMEAGASLHGLQLDSMLNLLAVHLLKQYGTAKPQGDLGGLSDRQMRLVNELMAERLSDGVSLDEIAGLTGLSSSQLLRSFRKRTGTSPHQYFMRLRLDRARDLIVNETTPLAQIAVECGFSSQSHMTSTMKRQDGLTPRDLRS